MADGNITLYVIHQITEFDANECLKKGYVTIVPKSSIVTGSDGNQYCTNHDKAVHIKDFRIWNGGSDTDKCYKGNYKHKRRYFERRIFFNSSGEVVQSAFDEYANYTIACMSSIITTTESEYSSPISLNSFKDFNIVDKFAVYSLNGFINRLDDPINADDTLLNRVADQAYQLALNMVINSQSIRNGYQFREIDSAPTVNVTNNIQNSTTE